MDIKKIRRLIKESLTIKKSCSCGCNICGDGNKIPVSLNENITSMGILSEGIKWHITTGKPLIESLYKPGSKKYFELWAEARSLYSRNILDITNPEDLKLIKETNLGEFGIYKNKKVPLDFYLNESKKIYKRDPIKKTITELDINSKVYSLSGLLIIDPQKNNVKNLLSDIRAIEGVTIVKEEAYNNVVSEYHQIIINIKIDPSPFLQKDGFKQESVDKIISDIKKLNGVIGFKTDKKLSSSTG